MLIVGRDFRRSASHSSAPIGGFGRATAGRSSMTGLPRRVMITSSPSSALSISFGRLFLASATLYSGMTPPDDYGYPYSYAERLSNAAPVIATRYRRGGCRGDPHAPVDRDDEARDQHLFACADAARAFRARAGTALRRCRDPRLSRYRLGARRLSRLGRARRC